MNATEGSKEQEIESEMDDLATLDVEAIEGIGSKTAQNLKSVKINTLEDLVSCEPAAVYEQAEISLYKLLEFKKKAEIILIISQRLKLEEETLKILGENGYSITKTIEEDLSVLQELTGKPREDLESLRDNFLLLLMVIEDHIARRKGSLTLLRKTKKMKKRPLEEEPLIRPEVPISEPTEKIEPPKLGMIKGGVFGGIGGLSAGLIGSALNLHPFYTAIIGIICSVVTWFVLHAYLKGIPD
ncbi:MAG: hypothetical protein ACE5I5_10650 [Candidatus Heimdallarchaeota archaeon]